jgi:hypothetical protein
MADAFTYVSVIPSTTPVRAAGTFGYVQFLNTDWMSGGGGGTTNIYNSTVINSTVMSNATYRSNVWALQGVVIQSDTPADGVQYSQWLAGAPGYWCWIKTP